MTGTLGTPGMTGRFNRGDGAILLSTLLWGTLWIPLRQLAHTSLPGSTASLIAYGMALAVLLPLAWRSRATMQGHWGDSIKFGLTMAVSVGLYAESMVRGEIARVLLLFYLTPLWSVLLGRLMLGVPVTMVRAFVVLLGFSGLVVVLGGQAGLPVPRTGAEWMALAAGMIWALCMVYGARSAAAPAAPRLALGVFFMLPLVFFLGAVSGDAPRLSAFGVSDDLQPILIWAAAMGIAWILPALWLTLYAAARIDPGRIAIFLLLEVVIGIATAMVLVGEPLHAHEAAGGALIVAAGVTEALSLRPKRA